MRTSGAFIAVAPFNPLGEVNARKVSDSMSLNAS